MKGDQVFRLLPDAYRRAGSKTVIRSLTGVLADSLEVLDRHGRQLLQSRFIDHLADLDDAERLAALFALVPWPEEDLAEFRHRVRQMARLYLNGAATAATLLEVVGAATDAVLLNTVLPGYPVADGSPPNDLFTTAGRFARRGDPAERFVAQVVDLPPVRQMKVVEPASGYVWEVENRTYADPGGFATPPTYPEPVVDFVAGERPVTLPILVQRDLRRFVLVNRFIPPGATLRVDLQSHTIHDVKGPATLQGPVTIGREPAPDLIYGTGGLAGDIWAYRLTDPPARSGAARPFHIASWNSRYESDPSLPPVPGPPGTADPVPAEAIPWPPLLGLGTSHWRLLVGVNERDQAPALDERLELNRVRPVPATPGTGPSRIDFRWVGRQLATFTVILPETHLCDGPAPTGKMLHRADWLREQILRLKPAGVIYLEPGTTALLPEPEEPVSEQRELGLWEVTPPETGLSLEIKSVARKAGLREEGILSDTISVTVTPSTEEE